jgi:proline dehydrogenase
MPGDNAEDALKAAAEFQKQGIAAVFTRLGESLDRVEAAEAVAQEYLMLIDAIQDRSIDGEISVKLTQLGSDIDLATAYGHLEGLVKRAMGCNQTVWIDMESSQYAEATISVYERLRSDHPNVGICLQAYLRRTAADLQRLLPFGASVRLVKGAYSEPQTLVYASRREINANYLALAVEMLHAAQSNGTVRIALGTHDVELVEQVADHAVALGLPKTAFEVHMLYGIRFDQQRRLAAGGYAVRDLVAYGEAWYRWYLRRLAERPANVIFALRQVLPDFGGLRPSMWTVRRTR